MKTVICCKAQSNNKQTNNSIYVCFTHYLEPQPVEFTCSLLLGERKGPPAAIDICRVFPHGSDAFFEDRIVAPQLKAASAFNMVEKSKRSKTMLYYSLYSYLKQVCKLEHVHSKFQSYRTYGKINTFVSFINLISM